MKALYTLDDNYAVRTSHENQSVKALYDNYLKELGSEAAHHLLHTKYYPRTGGYLKGGISHDKYERNNLIGIS